MTEDQDRELTRARVVWSDAENDRLVEGVRRGRSVEELAAELGRSVRAVTGRRWRRTGGWCGLRSRTVRARRWSGWAARRARCWRHGRGGSWVCRWSGCACCS